MVERTPNKSQHRRLTLKKKKIKKERERESTFLLPHLPGFGLATFRSRVRRSYQLYYFDSPTSTDKFILHDEVQHLITSVQISVQTRLVLVQITLRHGASKSKPTTGPVAWWFALGSIPITVMRDISALIPAPAQRWDSAMRATRKVEPRRHEFPIRMRQQRHGFQCRFHAPLTKNL